MLDNLEDVLTRTVAADVATMSPEMRDRYRAALAQAGQPVAVKALEWRGPDCGFYEADTIGGVVRIMDGLRDEPGRFIYNPASGNRTKFDTLEEAKAAAQADYERRILAVLLPPGGETATPDSGRTEQ